MSTKNDDLEIVALPYGFFCYDVRYPKEALIAQLDRVQVSEACGVGSSPAERTNLLLIINNLYLYTVVFK